MYVTARWYHGSVGTAFWQAVDGLSMHSHQFNTMPIHVGFVANTEA
jgi:hypothetical protein